MHKYKSLLLKILAFLIVMSASEVISIVAFENLALANHQPYPWSWVLLLRYGFYEEVLLGISLVIAPLALILAIFFTRGLTRYLAYCFMMAMALCFVSFGLGLGIFHYLEPDFYGDFTQALKTIHALLMSPIPYKHFIQAQFGSAALVSLITAHVFFEKLRPANKVLGNAHFAKGLAIKKAGFFEKEEESIIIGKKLGAPMYANGFEHVLVFAPSGSGKTRSIAIPNLFHYPYSVVCNDIKFTLYETTSGYRERVLGHSCYCFAPAHSESMTHRFNPLTFISEDKTLRIRDIQRIAHILMPDSSKSEPIWQQASRKLFKALVLYLLDTPSRPTTLGEINRMVKLQDFDLWLLDVLDNTDNYDAEFYRNGYSYITNHDKTRKSILESFSGYFELFDDPIVDAATSASDFDLRDLRRKKMTIYVGFTDEDMERLAPLLTLFWQQLISVMVMRIPDPVDEPYPLLCLIDEFSSLGRIERLRRSLKLLREYRVRCVLMFQYIAQTYEKYSHDEAKAFTNIKTKIAYGSEDNSDAEFISKMLGTRTKKVVTRAVSNQTGGNISASKNISYQAIPLLRPEEVMKLPSDISLIIRTGSPPVKAKQYIWYKESAMLHLPESPTKIPKQTITIVPFERMQPVKNDTNTQEKKQKKTVLMTNKTMDRLVEPV
jgi:type IV secretion system protein VirD4